MSGGDERGVRTAPLDKDILGMWVGDGDGESYGTGTGSFLPICAAA